MRGITVNVGQMNVEQERGIRQQETAAQENQRKSVFAANLNSQLSPMEERKKEGQKLAWKVVSDAWKGDRVVETSVEGRKEHYKQMAQLRETDSRELSYIEDDEAAVQQLYEVSDESEEQQDLKLLMREQDVENGVDRHALTAEEQKRLAEIHQKPLTEYQERELELNDRADHFILEMADAERSMRDDTSDIRQIKQESLKSHAMVDAQKSADEIMAAAYSDMMSMAVQDAVDNIDEQMEEVQEKAEKAAEKQEEKEELREEQKLQRAVQEALVKGTSEAIEDAKALERRNETKDVEVVDMLQIAQNGAEKQTGEVAGSLSDIKNNMKLLEADLKGIKVDEEA
jgi:hypothetical protein